mmetsp:Transcript_27521/g.68415  ORF Transcript_27521/g.68415 Transcript_27521/m.68415 type:complete len:333 (-) Transcript_27521:11-1009(-)
MSRAPPTKSAAKVERKMETSTALIVRYLSWTFGQRSSRTYAIAPVTKPPSTPPSPSLGVRLALGGSHSFLYSSKLTCPSPSVSVCRRNLSVSARRSSGEPRPIDLECASTSSLVSLPSLFLSIDLNTCLAFFSRSPLEFGSFFFSGGCSIATPHSPSFSSQIARLRLSSPPRAPSSTSSPRISSCSSISTSQNCASSSFAHSFSSMCTGSEAAAASRTNAAPAPRWARSYAFIDRRQRCGSTTCATYSARLTSWRAAAAAAVSLPMSTFSNGCFIASCRSSATARHALQSAPAMPPLKTGLPASVSSSMCRSARLGGSATRSHARNMSSVSS